MLVSSLGSFLHLIAIAAALLLTSCGVSTPTPVRGEGQRAAADRSVRAGTSLPRAFGTGQYDGTLTRSDDNRGEKIGALVPAQGGQKPQL